MLILDLKFNYCSIIVTVCKIMTASMHYLATKHGIEHVKYYIIPVL